MDRESSEIIFDNHPWEDAHGVYHDNFIIGTTTQPNRISFTLDELKRFVALGECELRKQKLTFLEE